MVNVLARKSQKEKVLMSYTGGVWKGRCYMDETFKQCLDANVELIEPIHGPINIGINTVIKILIPWNEPTLPSGV